MQIHYQIGFMNGKNRNFDEILAILLEGTGLKIERGKYTGIYLGARYYDFEIDSEDLISLDVLMKERLAKLFREGKIGGGFAGTKAAPIAS